LAAQFNRMIVDLSRFSRNLVSIGVDLTPI